MLCGRQEVVVSRLLQPTVATMKSGVLFMSCMAAVFCLVNSTDSTDLSTGSTTAASMTPGQSSSWYVELTQRLVFTVWRWSFRVLKAIIVRNSETEAIHYRAVLCFVYNNYNITLLLRIIPTSFGTVCWVSKQIFTYHWVVALQCEDVGSIPRAT